MFNYVTGTGSLNKITIALKLCNLIKFQKYVFMKCSMNMGKACLFLCSDCQVKNFSSLFKVFPFSLTKILSRSLSLSQKYFQPQHFSFNFF